jgi:hypothetical protein
MRDMDNIKARFRDVSSVPETLAASFGAFEVIRLLARDQDAGQAAEGAGQGTEFDGWRACDAAQG